MAGCAPDMQKAMHREQMHEWPAAHTSYTAGRGMQQGRVTALTLRVTCYQYPSAPSQCSGAVTTQIETREKCN